MFPLWCWVLTALAWQAVDSTSWPRGKYALLKPTAGCPEGWQGKGWLLQDTEDTNPSNNRSESLHIEGYVSPSYVMRSFCVKTTTGQGPDHWPQGKYCMYRKRNEVLPTGFKGADIKMNDEKSSNKDKAIYVEFYNWIRFSLSSKYSHLVLYFQCKTDGNAKAPISLPITKPFYLLPYGSRDCQQVEWMVATSEWIKYDLNNPTYTISVPEYSPFVKVTNDSRGSKDITMYYCYYQSCNYTLADKKGVFQSPGFPGKYPDGQLCSWRIMVPDNHTLHVQFTNFSLDENDTKDVLESYKYINGTFQLAQAFHGSMKPFTLTDTTDLLFKFLSNEEGHASGFRAEYTVFIPSETTQPPSSTPEASIPPASIYTATPTEHTSEISTTREALTTESMSKNRTAFALESKCKRIGTIVVIVIPLACLVFVVMVIAIVVHRYRLAMSKRKENEERVEDKMAANPIYDQGDILLNERGSTATMTTTMDFNTGQTYQTLSRDQKRNDYSDGHAQTYQSLSRDQKPEYDQKTDDPSTDPIYLKYHELEPVDHKVPDVVYDAFDGLNPNEGPPDDPMYQAVDETSNNEPLYQYTAPGTIVKQNQLYESFS